MAETGAFIRIMAIWRGAIDTIDDILRTRRCPTQPSVVRDHPVSRINHIIDMGGSLE
jgi:hypothetical protein